MATVTGTLADFGLGSLELYSGRIIFTPSGPATTGPAILATREIAVTPDINGAFTVTLARTDVIFPNRWYKIRVEWLNGAGIPTGLDVPDWKLFVPEMGGTLADLIEKPWNPVLAWWNETTPTGTPVANTLWLDPETGELSIWSK